MNERGAAEGVMSQHLLNPVENLVQVLKTPIKLAEKSSLNRLSNSVNIASGMRIAVNDCYILTVKTAGVEVSHTEGYNPYDQEAMEQDFATGGNDDIFGSDLESNIEAVRKIVHRLQNPLSEVSERNVEFVENEKKFYTALLCDLTED